MSLTRRRKPTGETKDWIVSFLRNGEIYKKRFLADQYNEAKKYHDILQTQLPPTTYHSKGGGTQGRPAVNTKSIESKIGCILKISKTEGVRCPNPCEHYNDCLMIAARRGWPGFKIEKETTKKC